MRAQLLDLSATLSTNPTNRISKETVLQIVQHHDTCKFMSTYLQENSNDDDHLDSIHLTRFLTMWYTTTYEAIEREEEASVFPSTSTTQTHASFHTVSVSFLAGGFAGIVSKSCLAPIDRIKILFQVTEKKFNLRNALHMGKNIVHHDGVKALFRGNSATVLRVMPYAGLQHSSFDYFRRKCMQYNERHYECGTEGVMPGRLSTTQTVLAGSMAGKNTKQNTMYFEHSCYVGALSVVCTYPLDIIRARLVVQTGALHPSGLFASIKDMYTTHGAASFTRGLAPTLMGILPYTGIGFALNEYMKQKLLGYQQSHYSKTSKVDPIEIRLTTFEKFSCSYVAACFAQSVTYPLDTVRRRMQTHGFVDTKSTSSYNGIYSTAKYIVKKESWRGLFKGLSVNWMRSPIATGLSLTAYDALKELMDVEPII